MKIKQNSSPRGATVQITFAVTFISLFVALLTIAAASARNQIQQKPTGPDNIVAQGLRYPVVIDPSWTATGSMGTARANHTATLLPSGKVLVAGGFNLSGVLSSAELCDPAAGTWTATGSLGTARQNHSATLLPSGKVLVVGGYNGSSGYLNSAELYDAAAETWTATGSMAFPRSAHTATLLATGKVLVAGEALVPRAALNYMIRRPGCGRRPAVLPTHATFTRRRCCPQARCWWLGDLTVLA
jgi:hypothetical protein